MKTFKYFLISLLGLIAVTGCQKDDYAVGDLIAPSNIQVTVDIVGADATNPNGDGSGEVNFMASADNAISYQYVYNGEIRPAPAGMQSYSFGTLGLNTYAVTVIAFGRGGISSSKTVEVEVLSTYSPPADLLTMLTADSSRTWKIAADVNQHFGLGPIGGDPFQYYGAAPGDKAATGMYDDRYTFNIDGTFTHDTGADGFVFGRKGLIDELGGSGGTANGDDIEQYPYASYTASWSLSAPGGVETISLSGLGFIGYYIGGNHKYVIFSRSANEMVLKSADGNGTFDWWFRLIPE
ncbi:hypothetical protein GCM10007962_06370 [Yeosuana aromativorans]|uniref:Glucan endo-1,3-beta-D-glucosidase n=1 Tax=Yeosuana aromativorans TaxID=288019 RepID=A0A8J3BJF6_9FLAO|nr:glucan endo-1,3-beta-D-glucosidase [Yeosuana aromativorans]GGK14853.1 hypothetical protein GCM10007962_06370 [Yeosuana aromativorans]